MKNSNTITCPACRREFNVKVSSNLGAHIPRHGHRNVRGVGGGDCIGSRCSAEAPATELLPKLELALEDAQALFAETGRVPHRQAVDAAQKRLDACRRDAEAEQA